MAKIKVSEYMQREFPDVTEGQFNLGFGYYEKTTVNIDTKQQQCSMDWHNATLAYIRGFIIMAEDGTRFRHSKYTTYGDMCATLGQVTEEQAKGWWKIDD